MADCKRCSTCKLPKPLTEYVKDNSRPDGLKVRCRQCHREAERARRQLNPEAEKTKRRQRNARNWISTRLRDARAHAKTKDREFTLTVPYMRSVYDSQQGRCYWTGVELEVSPLPHHPWQPSLDRIDSTKGYVPGNVVWAAWVVNRMKSDYTPEQFRDIIARLKA